jgi:hypothetical protein
MFSLKWTSAYRSPVHASANRASTSNAYRAYGSCDLLAIRRVIHYQWESRQDDPGKFSCVLDQ